MVLYGELEVTIGLSTLSSTVNLVTVLRLRQGQTLQVPL